MKWTHRGTIAVAYAIVVGLVVTRPDFEYWPWLPLLGVGGGSLFSINIIVQRQRDRQSESQRVAAVREEIKIREMERDYINKPSRDAGRTLLKIMIGLFVVIMGLALAPVVWGVQNWRLVSPLGLNYFGANVIKAPTANST